MSLRSLAWSTNEDRLPVLPSLARYLERAGVCDDGVKAASGAVDDVPLVRRAGNFGGGMSGFTIDDDRGKVVDTVGSPAVLSRRFSLIRG